MTAKEERQLMELVTSLESDADELAKGLSHRIIREIEKTKEASDLASVAKVAAMRGSEWAEIECNHNLESGRYYFIRRRHMGTFGEPHLRKWDSDRGWIGYIPGGNGLQVWE